MLIVGVCDPAEANRAPLLGCRASRLFAADGVVGPARPADRFDGSELSSGLGEVEHGARGSRDLAHGLKDLRSETAQVIDRRGGGENRVDRSLDVALTERAPPFRVDVGGAIELSAQLPDLVVRGLEKAGRVAVRGEIAERARGGHGRRQDPPIDVGQEPEEAGENEPGQDYERRCRRVPRSLQTSFGDGLAARKTALKIEEDVAHLRRCRQNDVVALFAGCRRASRSPE